MSLLGIGTGELLVILLIALLVLGPERLPEIARLWAKFSRTVGEFTRTWQNFNAQLNAELNRELDASQKRSAPAKSASATTATPHTIAPPRLPTTTSDHEGAVEAPQPPTLPAQPAGDETERPDASYHESE